MIAVDFLLGYFSSIVPHQILSDAYYDNKKRKDAKDSDFDYISVLRYTPLFFAVTNVIVMSLVDRVFIDNDLDLGYRFLVTGMIIGLTYSLIGRFHLQIPQEVLNMKDPVWFNVNAVFIWVIVYFILYWLRDNINRC